MKEKLETTIHFQNSNHSFYHAILSSTTPIIDIYIKIELLFLHFKREENNVQTLEEEDQKIIEAFLANNYTVSEEKIIFPNHILSIEELYETKRKMDREKGKARAKKIIQIPVTNQPDEEPSKEAGKIIPFTKFYNSLMYTMQERAYIFEVTNRLDSDTIPYVEETEKNASILLENIIEDVLTNHLEKYTQTELLILYAYLSLYPFLEYNKEQMQDQLEKLDIPQSQIGLRKSTYQDDEVEGLTTKLKHLQREHREIETQIAFLQENQIYNHRLKSLYWQMTDNQKQQEITMINLYMHTHMPNIYNKNLLQYICKCYYQSHIGIHPSGNDPVIKMFYIQKEQVEFYCAMHLDTLVNLIDAQVLLKGPEEKKLKLEVKDE